MHYPKSQTIIIKKILLENLINKLHEQRKETNNLINILALVTFLFVTLSRKMYALEISVYMLDTPENQYLFERLTNIKTFTVNNYVQSKMRCERHTPQTWQGKTDLLEVQFSVETLARSSRIQKEGSLSAMIVISNDIVFQSEAFLSTLRLGCRYVYRVTPPYLIPINMTRPMG